MSELDDFELELKRAEARGRLAALPDETLVSDSLAAVYYGLSEKQMKTLREKPDGPKFFKPLTNGSEKANMAAQYEMGELRRWRAEHTYESNLDAATRSGINKWVGEPRPFFTEDFGRNRFSILAPADDISRDDWGDRLASAIEGDSVHVEWLIPAEAAASRWSDASTHKHFAGEYLADLDAERGRIYDALSASDLAASI